jgi:pimeloyl-ACP methyl ester carboxylesterase
VSDPSIEQVTSAGRRLEVVVAGPGYAGSDADPGRSDADAAGDVSAILGHLGVDRFATLGWSGGARMRLPARRCFPSDAGRLRPWPG